ncbi:MAG TPA: hypothetical protein VHK91_05735, partial [Flavisolibacter sp.]|nr:hypothetical protein [Flavisolibacter sp.]
MHPKQAYEQTITSKLEALPVPDMADAIWARIEAQLDLDMPTDDGGGNPSSPSGGGWAGKASLFAVIAAIVIVYFLRSRTEHPDTFDPAPAAVPGATRKLPGQPASGPAPSGAQKRITPA